MTFFRNKRRVTSQHETLNVQKENKVLKQKIAELTTQNNNLEAETKRLYAAHNQLQTELHEVERQRGVFMQQRDGFEEETRRLYAAHEALEAELHEVERQRGVFMQQRDEFEAETKRLYAGHSAMEEEINFLKFRNEETSRLHDEVVMRKWRGDTSRQDFYCTFPFEHFEILPNGDVYTCCSGWLKSGYCIGNIYEQTVKEIWNSERAKILRYSVTRGDFEYCQEYCMYLANREKADSADSRFAIKRKDADTSWLNNYDYKNAELPDIIALSCDETCNLKCPSCRSHFKVFDAEQSERLENMLMKKVRPMLHSCKYIDMLGSGEVFASNACSNFLKSLTKNEFPQLQIRIISNAQLFTVHKWNEFDNLHQFPLIFHVSIDAAEKQTYEKLRLGAKWETLLENMKLIASLRQQGNICDLTISMVVQKANYQQMPAFVELAKEWNADAVQFQHITNWGTQSTESYEENDIFSAHNPLREEAISVLTDVVHSATDIKVLQNIIDVK